MKIISDFIKEPTLRNTPFAIEHGIYLAKKLKDKEMEQVFKNVKSKVKVSTKGLANPRTTVAMRRLDKQPSSVGIRGISHTGINMHATNKNLNKLLSKDSQLMESRKLLSKMLQHRKIGSNISTHKRISMKRIGYGLTSAKTNALYGKTGVVSADKSKVSANKSK